MKRAGAVGVHSISRFAFSVPDLEDAKRFYSVFGLDVRGSGERLDLYTFGHPHCWASVFANGARKRLEYVSYGVFAEDLGLLTQRVDHLGLRCDPHPHGESEALWLRDPDGVPTQLVVAPQVAHAAKTAPNGQLRPAPRRGRVAPVRPRRLSHILRFTSDVSRMVAFCSDVLGLRLSDRSQDVIAFMHGAHGSDHHMVAFAKSTAPGLHHSSWDVGSIDEIGCGAEQLRACGYVKGWGVGRHVIGSNYFYYAQDPWGSFAEYSFDIDYVPHDAEWCAGDYPLEDSLYVWGPTVPEDFVRNYEAA